MQVFQFIKNRYGSKKGLIKAFYYYFWGKFHPEFGQIAINAKRVVFVCKGNICRSALAEVYFRTINNFECCSVGLDTTSGKSANQRVIDISKKHDVNMSSHLTTSILDFSPRNGDIYICMEPEHIVQLKQYSNHYPTILLGAFGSPQKSYIHDPYNANDEYAEACVKYIIAAVNNFSHALISSHNK